MKNKNSQGLKCLSVNIKIGVGAGGYVYFFPRKRPELNGICYTEDDNHSFLMYHGLRASRNVQWALG